MSRHTRISFLAATLLALAVGLSACSGETPSLPTLPEGGITTQAPEGTQAPETTAAPETTQAPDTTAAPTTTQAPDTTAAADDEGEGEAPWWILILGGLLFLILIVALARSGKKKNVTVAASGPTWKELARSGYADSRWLFDALNESLAIWRGNARYDQTTAVGASAETANAATWEQLTPRMGKATDNLYALEAAAPDTRTAETARRVVDTLNETRADVDARAEARYAYRAAEAESEGQPNRTAQMATGRDREQRASENLSESRRRLAEALTSLSAIT